MSFVKNTKEPLLGPTQVVPTPPAGGTYSFSQSLRERKVLELQSALPSPPSKTAPLTLYESLIQKDIVAYHVSQSGLYLYVLTEEDVIRYDLKTMKIMGKGNYKDHLAASYPIEFDGQDDYENIFISSSHDDLKFVIGHRFQLVLLD